MRLSKVLAVASSIGVVLACAPVAEAISPANRLDTAIGRANPYVSQEVIDNLPSSVLDRSDIWIDPTVSVDTVWLTPEGDVIPDQNISAKSVSAIRQNRWTAVSPAFTSGVEVKSNEGYIGLDSNTTITYHRTTDSNSGGTSCWTVKHFVPKIPTVSDWQEEWTGAGCADGSKSVSWGKIAAVPSVKLSNNGHIGWAGEFYI